MEKDVKWLMEKAGMTVEELAEIINHSDGRPKHKSIVAGAICENEKCKQPFFCSTPTIKERRRHSGGLYCSSCREGMRREKKREFRECMLHE